MILGSRCFSEAYRFYSSFVVNLFVTPHSICPHVCAIEVGLRRIEHHAVDCSLVAVLKILDVFLEVAGGVDGEYVTVTGIVVEGVAVYCVWGLLRRKEEDGAGLGVRIICFGCRSC
jgi:hypothetical protein